MIIKFKKLPSEYKGSIPLFYEICTGFLESLLQEERVCVEIGEHPSKISGYNSQDEKIFDFWVPLVFPRIERQENLASYIEKIPTKVAPYIILLIQAGSCSMGYYEEGQVVHHKVIKKYMVRKKQGKAQVTYLKSKGKSRAGSRVRLAQTIEFFEEINQKLQIWAKEKEIHHLFYSCPVRLWGMLFQSKVQPPFEKKDSRLLKIPLDVNVPSHEELQSINYFAFYGFAKKYQEGKLDFFGKWDD